VRANKVTISFAGVTKESMEKNKTGTWRTFRPVITDKCTGCGICVSVCPEQCIQLVDRNDGKFKKKSQVNYDYCKGCLICANECPFKAIIKEREK
jgi:pyruvate ferredoxin oxidoreductase delta subunit